DKIKDYLPASISENLPNVDVVTIRHLLGHTSGYANYDQDPELNELYITGRLKLDTLSHEEALKRYVYGKDVLNQPGEKYSYSSTNYMLLAMVLDSAISGYATFLRKGILKDFGFKKTYYKQTPNNQTLRYYGDLNRDGVSEDLTDQTFETTNWFIGDDGVYAPIEEAGRFIEDLMKGRILNEEYLKEMKTWDNKKNRTMGTV
ncbi:MAG: beta-lactamase family protein, partial [Cyclobacteriaceae bacterium]|nr:beta-lactamase family protein [Cyclobacteriaceae bacterium]